MSRVLSICIPTYNRVDFLKQSVESIICSIEFSNEDVEIVISDNCSSDNTEKYCKYLTQKYSFIKYFRNDENVVELNFYFCIQRATSKFVWVFGDDDLISINAISQVLNYLTKGHNLLILNYSIFDEKVKNVLKKNYLGFSNNQKIKNHDELLMRLNLKLGFISCVVFQREEYLKMPLEIYDRYRTYGFSFLYGLLNSVYKNTNAIVISNELLQQRGIETPANIFWWYNCFVEGSGKIFHELQLIGYSKISIKGAKNNIFFKIVLPDLIWRKRIGENIKSVYNILYNNYKYNWVILIIIELVFLTPYSIFNLLSNVKKSLFS
jgi:glycosyltransferase involved in cell wall biosynthesis